MQRFLFRVMHVQEALNQGSVDLERSGLLFWEDLVLEVLSFYPMLGFVEIVDDLVYIREP